MLLTNNIEEKTKFDLSSNINSERWFNKTVTKERFHPFK
jgi:hypothetical protein